MAKKTIIPDFTIALGADLREAAAKMREMSRPPVHSPAPPAAPEQEPSTPSEPAKAVDGPQERAPSEEKPIPSVPPQAPEASGGLAASPAGTGDAAIVTQKSQEVDKAGSPSIVSIQHAAIADSSPAKTRHAQSPATAEEPFFDASEPSLSAGDDAEATRGEASPALFVSERQHNAEPLSPAPPQTWASSVRADSALHEEASSADAPHGTAPRAETPEAAVPSGTSPASKVRAAVDELPHTGAAAVASEKADEEALPPFHSAAPATTFGSATDARTPGVPAFDAGKAGFPKDACSAPEAEMAPHGHGSGSSNTAASGHPADISTSFAAQGEGIAEKAPQARPQAALEAAAPSPAAHGQNASTGQPCAPIAASPTCQESVAQAPSVPAAEEPGHRAAPEPGSVPGGQGCSDDEHDRQIQPSTVTDGHLPTQTVNDNQPAHTPADRLEQSPTVINHQQPSQTVTDSTQTATDRHLQSSNPFPTSIQASPAPERLTDVSAYPQPKERTFRMEADEGRPSASYAAPEFIPNPDLPFSRTAKRDDETGYREASSDLTDSYGKERPTAPRMDAPPSRRQSSTVTMTVNDTYKHPLQQTYPHRQTEAEAAIAAATLQEAPIGGARQTLLSTLERLRGQSPQVVVNLKRLAAAIGLSYGTVRNTISRLVREGVICTTQVRTGEAHGVCIEFLDDAPLQSVTVMTPHPAIHGPGHAVSPQTVTGSHQQSMTQYDTCSAVPSVTYTMTGDDTSIWNADAGLIADLWPCAAEAGFGPAHLAHLHRAYRVQGWDTDNVPRCLRYLDWELAVGLGSGPAHVDAWMRIMRRQGHYPRPEGYVEPEVLRFQQQAQEQRELAQAQQELADAQALLNPARQR